jgi:arylsulfatase A
MAIPGPAHSSHVKEANAYQSMYRRVLTACAALVLCAAAAAEQARPNIVFLLADDLGYADLSVYGSPHIQTPHLDGLAKGGLRFTDFYAASAVCSPSRAATLTGRFSVRVGVYSWILGPMQAGGGQNEPHKMHLPADETTIAGYLKRAGYATGHFGKWHLGGALVEGVGAGPNPGDHGFDHWLATENNAAPSHRNPANFIRNGERVGEIEDYSCQFVVDEALAWLDAREDKKQPFFLNIWFNEPHRSGGPAAPQHLETRHQDTRLPAYYGSVENVDTAIGRLLGRLDAMGVGENTLVVFSSDNGSYLDGSNDPLRGRKTQLWEGGIRVPGILRWPGRIEPGTVTDTPAGVVDLLPTFCEAAGVAPDGKPVDGTSLLPLFRGEPLARAKPLYWFYSPSRPVAVLRDGDWCLTADPEIDLPRGNMFLESYIGDIKATALTNFQLFNLRRDIGQDRDVAAKHPEVFAEMKRKMTELHAEVVEEAPDWRTWEW